MTRLESAGAICYKLGRTSGISSRLISNSTAFMDAPLHKLAALVVCCCLAVSAGCAATADSAGGMFGKLVGRKTTEQKLNIKTPEDHLEELRELAKSAPKKSPEEQSRIADTLAAEIQEEQDPLMRRQILRTLAEYPTPVSMNILIAGLADADVEVRRVACQSLGRVGGPQAVQELTRVSTSDTDIDVRISAVRALGATSEKAALVPLVDALADRDPAIQFRAQESLRTLSGHDYGADVQAWREYANTGKSNAAEVSEAERLRRSLF
jgi:HEAT repeat protein